MKIQFFSMISRIVFLTSPRHFTPLTPIIYNSHGGSPGNCHGIQSFHPGNFTLSSLRKLRSLIHTHQQFLLLSSLLTPLPGSLCTRLYRLETTPYKPRNFREQVSAALGNHNGGVTNR